MAGAGNRGESTDYPHPQELPLGLIYGNGGAGTELRGGIYFDHDAGADPGGSHVGSAGAFNAVSGHFKMHHSWSLQSAPPLGGLIDGWGGQVLQGLDGHFRAGGIRIHGRWTICRAAG